MTTHLMTDIESLGVRPGAIVLSAAFVRFTDEAQMIGRVIVLVAIAALLIHWFGS